MLRNNNQVGGSSLTPITKGISIVLGALRSFVGGWIAKVLLVLLVLSFAVWGISGSILGGGYTNSVASVGETKVSVRDFLGNYQANLNRTQQQLQQRLTTEQARLFGVERAALNQSVAFATMDEFSRELNIGLSDDKLAQLIGQNTVFHDSTGAFSQERFRQAVYQAQMRESDFIDNQNRAAIRSQIAQAVAAGNLLPDVYKNALSSYASEERKFSYIVITPEIAGEPQDATDQQLKEFFEANKARYKAPEYRKLSILSLEPKDIANGSALDDETLKADYEAKKASYEEPEKRRVQQIVFSSREKADAAAKDLSEGAFFESVLRDNNIKLSDADLGLVIKSGLPDALQDAAFALELDETSQVVDGPFGATILRVTEIEEAKITPFEDVKEDIRNDIALRTAADQIINIQETIEDARAGNLGLEEVASQVNLKTRTIEAVDATARDEQGNIIADIPESSQLLRQAFETEVGGQSSPLDIGSTGFVWYDVLEIKPSRDRTFDEVKERVVQDRLAEERGKAVSKKAGLVVSRLKKGESIAKVAEELETELKTTGFLKRSGQEEAFPPTATQAGFGGDKKLVVSTPAITPGSEIVLTVNETKRPEAEISNLPQNQADSVNGELADDLITQLISNLQNSYPVTYNQPLIQQALTRQHQ